MPIRVNRVLVALMRRGLPDASGSHQRYGCSSFVSVAFMRRGLPDGQEAVARMSTVRGFQSPSCGEVFLTLFTVVSAAR